MRRRLFISIPLDEILKRELTAFTLPLTGVQWTRKDNLHITVAFLGDTDENLVPAITKALLAILLNFPPFTLSFDEIRFVPQDAEHARMIWAEYKSSKKYCDLVRAVQSTIAPLHAPFALQIASDSKQLRPHVTLARAKEAGVFRSFELLNSQMPDLEVSKLELIESRLTSAGPQYKVLQTFTF